MPTIEGLEREISTTDSKYNSRIARFSEGVNIQASAYSTYESSMIKDSIVKIGAAQSQAASIAGTLLQGMEKYSSIGSVATTISGLSKAVEPILSQQKELASIIGGIANPVLPNYTGITANLRSATEIITENMAGAATSIVAGISASRADAMKALSDTTVSIGTPAYLPSYSLVDKNSLLPSSYSPLQAVNVPLNAGITANLSAAVFQNVTPNGGITANLSEVNKGITASMAGSATSSVDIMKAFSVASPSTQAPPILPSHTLFDKNSLVSSSYLPTPTIAEKLGPVVVNHLVSESIVKVSEAFNTINPFGRVSEAFSTINPFGIAQTSVSKFFSEPIVYSYKSPEPITNYYAQLPREVHRVPVDTPYNSGPIVRAKDNHTNVIAALTSIILLKNVNAKFTYIPPGGDTTLNSISDNLDEQGTQYPSFLEDVFISTEDNKITTLADWSQELIESGHISKVELKDAQELAHYGEEFYRKNYEKVVYPGAIFLLEAAVAFVLKKPISAKKYHEFEKLMSDPIRDQLPKLSVGGNTRGGNAWEEIPPRQFVKKVNELYDLAKNMVQGYTENRQNPDWLGKLKGNQQFKEFLKVCKEQVVDDVVALLPARIKEYLPKRHKHGRYALGFACELAARELNLKKKDGNFFKVEYLLRMYYENGGTREKRESRKMPPQPI